MTIKVVLKNKTIIGLTDVFMFNFFNGVFDYYTKDMQNFKIDNVIGVNFLNQ